MSEVIDVKQKLAICKCMGVSEQVVYKMISKQNCDLDQLIDLTGASTVCGTCINDLVECIQKVRQKRDKYEQGQKLFPFLLAHI